MALYIYLHLALYSVMYVCVYLSSHIYSALKRLVPIYYRATINQHNEVYRRCTRGAVVGLIFSLLFSRFTHVKYIA